MIDNVYYVKLLAPITTRDSPPPADDRSVGHMRVQRRWGHDERKRSTACKLVATCPSGLGS